MPPKAAAAAAVEEAEASGPPEPPAGGLDMPFLRPNPEVESFPGESLLTEDERNRWLILHFALPRTIMTSDMAEKHSTEVELNDALSGMAWGTVDAETGDWALESEEPTPSPPHASLISYSEYVARSYPSDHSMEEQAREENARMAAQKRATFTNQGEPGAKFRPMFDQMVKNLAHSNKALLKAFDIKKPILDEAEVADDPSRSEAQAIMRFGRHQILPAFWQLLIHLTKKNRRFSVVFRTFSEEQLKVVQKELELFCQGQHPAYSGTNKTQKPPPMSGDKGSRDLRLADASIGRIDRFSTPNSLMFINRPSAPIPAAVPEGEVQVTTKAQPTTYSFPPFHEAYSGLMHQILDGVNTAAIVDDFDYWDKRERTAEAGKLLLVDHAGGIAETKVQHVFFDGNIRLGDAHCVDIRDVVKGEPLPLSEVENVFAHRVDLFQAVTDNEYFIKAVEMCELNMSRRIVESRRTQDLGPAAEEAALPPKEWLYRNIIPALLPALEACQRDRPADPIEYIAFYMLRHPKQYSKSLKS